MELFELIAEVVFEGIFEACTCRKIPKYIRYPLIGIVSLFIFAVIGLIFYAGIRSLKKSILGGAILISVGSLLLVMSIITFRKAYLSKKNKK